MQRAKIAWKECFKALRVKPHATIVPADGGIRATVRPAATLYHRDRTCTHRTVSKPFVNMGTLVPVPTHHKRLVQKVRTPTTWVPSPAFLVYRVNFPAKRQV